MPDCSHFTQPGTQRDGPDEETTDWRAVCGKTACTVRRAGWRKPSRPLSATREVVRLLKDGYTFVVDADLQAYFDTIAHDALMARVEEWISDGRVLDGHELRTDVSW